MWLFTRLFYFHFFKNFFYKCWIYFACIFIYSTWFFEHLIFPHDFHTIYNFFTRFIYILYAFPDLFYTLLQPIILLSLVTLFTHESFVFFSAVIFFFFYKWFVCFIYDIFSHMNIFMWLCFFPKWFIWCFHVFYMFFAWLLFHMWFLHSSWFFKIICSFYFDVIFTLFYTIHFFSCDYFFLYIP